MSPEPWQERVRHMLTAIKEIRQFTAGMDRDTFKSDLKTVRAVCADFNIIGEAAKHIPDSVQERTPTIPWPKVRGMRNFIVHAYQLVDEDILWDTIERDLDPLEAALIALLAEEETNE